MHAQPFSLHTCNDASLDVFFVSRKLCLSPPSQDPEVTKVSLRQTVGDTAVIREVRWGSDAMNSLVNTRVDDCEHEFILEFIDFGQCVQAGVVWFLCQAQMHAQMFHALDLRA